MLLGRINSRLLKNHLNNSKRALSYSLYTWGQGDHGQLGIANMQAKWGATGNTIVQRSPRRLVGIKPMKDIALGEKFSLGVSESGHLFGWGQVWGLGNKGKVKVPVPIALSLDGIYVSCAAGKHHAAAIDKDGNVWTFGRGNSNFSEYDDYEDNNDNTSKPNKGDKKEGSSWFSNIAESVIKPFRGEAPCGWLGHGDNADVDKPKMIEWLKEYGAQAKKVSCGDKHTLILTTDGEVLVCGAADYGRLGTGDEQSVTIPTTIEVLEDIDIIDIAAGSNFSLALAADGRVYSWGANSRGQLGLADSYMDVYSFEQYPELVATQEITDCQIKRVIACSSRAALLTDNNGVYQWGKGTMHVPTQVKTDHITANGDSIVDIQIGGGSGGGGGFSLAMITRDGDLYTVGDSMSGLLARKASGAGVLSDTATHVDMLAFTKTYEGQPVPKIRKIFGSTSHMACLADVEI